MINKFMYTVTNDRLIEKNDRIIIGLSGGADSVCLLHLLTKIREEYCISIIAVHIHHGLRGDLADGDLEFCRSICEKLNVPLEIYFYNIRDIAAEQGLTIEEAGREKRYEAFREAAGKWKANKVAIAHNMNDQAETLLMRFFRGTGLKGLAGIRQTTGNIIRPLLFIMRDEIESYCLENDISYRVDLSNFDTDYTRNNIRQTVIPKITNDFNANIVETLSRTARLLNEENEFLESLAEKYYRQCSTNKGLDIKELEKIDIVMRRRVLRRAISEFSLKDVSSENIAMSLALMNKSTGKSVSLPGGIIIQRNYDHLTISNGLASFDYSYDVDLSGEIFASEINMHLYAESFKDNFNEFSHETEYTILLDYDKIVQAVKLRNRRPGDVIRMNSMTKKLKKYFIDEKIPRLVRNVMPLLADGENIICIMPDKISDIYRVTEKTKNIVQIGVTYLEGDNIWKQ